MSVHLNPSTGRYSQPAGKAVTPIAFGNQAQSNASIDMQNENGSSSQANEPPKISMSKRFTAFFSRKNIAEGIDAAEKRTNEIFTSKSKAAWEITKLFMEIGLLAVSSGLYLPLALAFPRLNPSAIIKSFVQGVHESAIKSPTNPKQPE